MSILLQSVKAANRVIAPFGVRLARAGAPSASASSAPPMTYPAGFSRAQLLRSLISLKMDRPAPAELRAYAEADCDRFIYTLGMVPEHGGSVLEIGANPYFTTILLKQFRSFDITITNFFAGLKSEAFQDISYTTVFNKQIEERLNYWNVNAESDKLPYDTDSFDLVLFCEVLEHMTNDPVAALTEIKRILRPGGQLILTTPNVARTENVARLIAGENLYDPYSGYGPYGRHNREYTVAELERLMIFCGFEREILFTGNVSSTLRDGSSLVEDVIKATRTTDGELGQYIFSRWQNAGPIKRGKPTWLYRSYASEELAD
ncbi:class I SAM-dependent methyltransferase [Sphingosinicellaceae bacterium]|nr:class I SAM-dependent methyltransferase [Sphingosinicellaceae bacterium]